MSTVDRDRARAAFEAYVEPYDIANPRIALKVAHTYRVAAIAERIAAAEGWPAADVDLAWLCGLLHDIGRFEQLRLWDTFRDAGSASHAALGEAVLAGSDPAGVPANAPALADPAPARHPSCPLPGSGALRSFVDASPDDALILASVAQHSAFRVEAGLDARTIAFCDLARDADKVDILRVNCENTPMTILGATDAEFLASGFSRPALQAFAERRCIARDERREPADQLLGMVCFVFELVYPESLRIVREQGHLDRLLRCPFGVCEPFARADARAAWARVGREVEAWMDGRLRSS